MLVLLMFLSALDFLCMKLSIGIVGLPNVGKSTLFKLLTKQEVNTANYPFATIDPNVGIVPVPDERLEKVAAVSQAKEVIPAVVEFLDIAGLVKGSHRGEGLGNQFLARIRETQAIIVVLRIFGNPEIVHVEASVDPLRDLETLNSELVFKDLETVEKRLKETEPRAKSGDKKLVKELEILKRLYEMLNGGKLAQPFRDEEVVWEMQLLTAKRQIYLLNGKKEEVSEGLLGKIKNLGADYIVADLAETQAMPDLIKKAYEILGLISFFTVESGITRAWTVTRGTLIPRAAGVIHTDFEKNFIRAEVINWQKLLEAAHSTGSGQDAWVQAKQKGLIRLEGKEYVVEDGDVIAVRHG